MKKLLLVASLWAGLLTTTYAQVTLYDLSRGRINKYETATNKATTVYKFSSSSAYAPGGLMEASDGKLYGMFEDGGTANAGTLFSFDPLTNTYTLLVNFTGSNGSLPHGTLLQAKDGLLYGTTQAGGTSSNGVLFSYDIITHIQKVLYNFDYATGADPIGDLIQGLDGKLYGLTWVGGPSSSGVIYSFDPDTNQYTTLSNFGSQVGTLAQGNNGKLYGATKASTGSIFSFNPVTRVKTIIHSYDFFSSTRPLSASMPDEGVIKAANGKIYGLLGYGGEFGGGAIYSIDPTTDAYTEMRAPVYSPAGKLVQASDGKLYGRNDSGFIFSFDPVTNQFTVLADVDPSGFLLITKGGLVEWKPIAASTTNDITTATPFKSSYHPGDTMQVNYTALGKYPLGNYFITQLSNPSGSFVSYTNIGWKIDTLSGTLTAVLPYTLALGSHYHIRTVASNTGAIGADNGQDFSIVANIPPNSIATIPTYATTYHAGDTLHIGYVAVGRYPYGNYFVAQMTNASGNYLSYSMIGMKADTLSGMLTGTIPASAVPGTKYRIRILASNTGTIGSDNGQDITITAPALSIALQQALAEQSLAGSLSASVYPNPSVSAFTLSIHSSNLSDKVQLKVVDYVGRIIEQRSLNANQNLQLGAAYPRGVYLVELRQGNQKNNS